MKDGDLISIVVPIYNVEKYLDRCVTSIINQTYSNLEIILVDDGSPDCCPQMCDEWAKKDSRIRVIHKQNAGLGMARNTGIDHANGKYICFFDSDDYIAENTIDLAYNAAIERNADMVTFGLTDVDIDERELGRDVSPIYGFYQHQQVINEFLPILVCDELKSASGITVCASACTVLFKKKIFEDYQIRFKSERELISEDMYFLLGLCKYIDSVVVLPKALYFYTCNLNSLSHTYREDRFEKIKYCYFMCIQKAVENEYDGEVLIRISALFFGYMIGAMKHIAVEKFGVKKEKELITEIVDDQVLQEILLAVGYRFKSIKKNVLSWAVRHRKINFVRILLHAKTRNN